MGKSLYGTISTDDLIGAIFWAGSTATEVNDESMAQDLLELIETGEVDGEVTEEDNPSWYRKYHELLQLPESCRPPIWVFCSGYGGAGCLVFKEDIK